MPIVNRGIKNNAVTASKIADGTIVAADISDASLTGLKVAVGAVGNTTSIIPVLHVVTVPAGTTGNVDTVIVHKFQVTNVWLVKTTAAGGGAGTITVSNTGNTITDAMDINVNDKVVVRAATIDDANSAIAASGTLRVVRTRSASSAEDCLVYVLGYRTA